MEFVLRLIAACASFPVHLLLDEEKEYIDYLGSPRNEVDTLTVQGQDDIGRLFFLFKLIVHSDGGPVYCWDTIFQRYRDDMSNWKICGHHAQKCLSTIDEINPEQFQFYTDLASKGRAVITKEMNPSLKRWVGCRVTIGTPESRAASLIQRNWQLVSENPDYLMCKRIRVRQMMLLGMKLGLDNIRPMFPSWTQEDFEKVFPELTSQ